VPLLVGEHVVGSEVAVDEPVLRAGRHGGGEPAGNVRQLPAGRCHPLDTGGCGVQVGQGAIEHDLLTRPLRAGGILRGSVPGGAVLAGRAAGDVGQLAETGPALLVHHRYGGAQQRQCLIRTGPAAFQPRLQ
jgi:hypothetical protein